MEGITSIGRKAYSETGKASAGLRKLPVERRLPQPFLGAVYLTGGFCPLPTGQEISVFFKSHSITLGGGESTLFFDKVLSSFFAEKLISATFGAKCLILRIFCDTIRWNFDSGGINHVGTFKMEHH